jgi:hypothetical protein
MWARSWEIDQTCNRDRIVDRVGAGVKCGGVCSTEPEDGSAGVDFAAWPERPQSHSPALRYKRQLRDFTDTAPVERRARFARNDSQKPRRLLRPAERQDVVFNNKDARRRAARTLCGIFIGARSRRTLSSTTKTRSVAPRALHVRETHRKEKAEADPSLRSG